MDPVVAFVMVVLAQVIMRLGDAVVTRLRAGAVADLIRALAAKRAREVGR
jgi:hypothetical protein